MNALAQRSGLSLTMISFVERHLRNPTLDTLLRISRALEVDLGVIIKQATDSETCTDKKPRRLYSHGSGPKPPSH